MPRYLAERYLVREADAEVAATPALAEPRSGEGVRLLEALYIPEDEICLYVFESDSVELVEQAGRFDRIVPVVSVSGRR